MNIPSAVDLILPALEAVKNGNDFKFGDVVMLLAEKYNLSEDEQRIRLAKAGQSRFTNRVGWAVFDLKKAGLIESAGYGKLRITEFGRQVLSESPTTIDRKFLLNIPMYKEFIEKTTSKGEEIASYDQTPNESLESSYQKLQETLAEELLENVLDAKPSYFEDIVLDVLLAMGYGGSREDAGIALGKPGDEGIDGVIKEDRLGLESIYIQAKRWKKPIGRPQVQSFVGSLEGLGATKGILITTSYFTGQAIDYVKKIQKKVVLVDGNYLAKLMIEHNVGVTKIATYEVKKVDLDYFET